MKRNHRIKFLIGFFLAIYGYVISDASAAVTCTRNISSMSVSASGDVSVQRDSTVGQPISDAVAGTMQQIAQCTISASVFYVNIESATSLSSGTTSYNGRAVFGTNVNGAGITLGINGGFTTPGRSNYYIKSGSTYITINGISNTGTGSTPVYIQPIFQLVKTLQPMSSGTVSGTLANVVLRQGSATGAVLLTFPVTYNATVKVLACSINNNTVNIPLDTVASASFTGVNSTQGDKLFTIGLSCDAGARVNAQMSFTTDTDSTDSSVIAVTGKGQSGIASGVGIQLLYGSTPLKNGENVVLKTSAGGAEFPTGAFTARYYQTKDTVMPGNANATATMTLTYQ